MIKIYILPNGERFKVMKWEGSSDYVSKLDLFNFYGLHEDNFQFTGTSTALLDGISIKPGYFVVKYHTSLIEVWSDTSFNVMFSPLN